MFSDILRTLVIELVAVLIFMTAAFILSQRLGRYDVADIAWGLVFIVIATTGYVVGGAETFEPTLITVLVAVWGLRLSGHIYRRFRRKAEEDRRYTEMRASFESHPVALPYLKVFVVQGLLALVITLPVTIAATTSWSFIRPLDVVGVVVWLVGFIFETVGDAQLTRFIADPSNRGKLLTSGLWHYTRHPNYFGEITQWWGIGLIALSTPFGWLGLIGPCAITLFIVKVSGVPLLEKAYTGRSDWEAYRQRTSMLIPMLPNRKAI